MPRTIATLSPRTGNTRGGAARESAYSEAPDPGKRPTPEALAEAARALQIIEEAQKKTGVMSTVQDQYASLLQTHIAKFGQPQATRGAGAQEVKFDSHDVFRWAASVVFTWWKGIKKFDFANPGELTGKIDDKCRVAVFGDWATGLYGAPEVSKSIVKDGNYKLVLHLGDTYYSGDDEEVDDALIAAWPKVPGAISRALNGNHEMYTGGRAYFSAIKQNFGQDSSYFAYQNDHFILASLDTAYADHDLHGDQSAWIGRLLAQAAGRKLILFSHHQPYSLLDSQGPKLVAKLAPYLASRQIFAWYWGHEHRCILYDKHPEWGLIGRCIGHGGFPEFRNKIPGSGGSATRFLRLDERNLVPGGTILDGPNPDIPEHENDYGPHGYVSLEFDGPRLVEQVRSASGEVLNTLELAK